MPNVIPYMVILSMLNVIKSISRKNALLQNEINHHTLEFHTKSFIIILLYWTF